MYTLKSNFYFLCLISFLGFHLTSISHAQTMEDKIAVLRIDHHTHLKNTDIDFLNNRMEAMIQKYTRGFYQVMTQQNINLLLPPDQTLEDCKGSCEVETGRLLGAQLIITASISILTDDPTHLILNAKLYDTKTAVQVNQHHIKATSITLLDQQMDAFCRELLFGQYSSTSNLKDEKLKFEKVEKFESEIQNPPKSVEHTTIRHQKKLLILPMNRHSHNEKHEVEAFLNHLKSLLEAQHQYQTIMFSDHLLKKTVVDHCVKENDLETAKCLEADFYTHQELIDFPNQGLYLRFKLYQTQSHAIVFETVEHAKDIKALYPKLKMLSEDVLKAILK
jgi:hypothetical protein